MSQPAGSKPAITILRVKNNGLIDRDTMEALLNIFKKGNIEFTLSKTETYPGSKRFLATQVKFRTDRLRANLKSDEHGAILREHLSKDDYTLEDKDRQPESAKDYIRRVAPPPIELEPLPDISKPAVDKVETVGYEDLPTVTGYESIAGHAESLDQLFANSAGEVPRFTSGGESPDEVWLSASSGEPPVDVASDLAALHTQSVSAGETSEHGESVPPIDGHHSLRRLVVPAVVAGAFTAGVVAAGKCDPADKAAELKPATPPADLIPGESGETKESDDGRSGQANPVDELKNSWADGKGKKPASYTMRQTARRDEDPEREL